MAVGYCPRIVTDGLILCLDAANRESYPGSGTVWRDLARSNNGTLTNGPTFNSVNGGSIVFDGVDDFVRCSDNTSIQFGTGNLTWAVWVKTGNSNINGTMIGKRNTVGDFPMISLAFGTQNIGGGGGFTSISSKKINFALRVNSSNQYVGNTNNDIIDGNWKYIVMVRNSGILQIYSNGVNQSFTTIHNVGAGINSNISLIGVNCLVGATTNGAGDAAGAIGFLNGNIASVQMYNRALTPAEVLQNYNATRGRFGI